MAVRVTKTIKGYKGFKKGEVDSNGKVLSAYCNPKGGKGIVYREGKTKKMLDREPVLCRSGFHFCKTLDHVNSFYRLSNPANVFAEVEVPVGSLIDERPEKSTANQIKVVRFLTTDEVKLHVYKQWYRKCRNKLKNVEVTGSINICPPGRLNFCIDSNGYYRADDALEFIKDRIKDFEFKQQLENFKIIKKCPLSRKIRPYKRRVIFFTYKITPTCIELSINDITKP